jgi:hypothetical protein
VSIAQLVRALDCGSRGRRFKSGYSPFLLPKPSADASTEGFFILLIDLKKEIDIQPFSGLYELSIVAMDKIHCYKY